MWKVLSFCYECFRGADTVGLLLRGFFFPVFSVKFLKKPGEGGDLIKFFFDLCESWVAANSLSLSFQPVRRWIFSICTGLNLLPRCEGLCWPTPDGSNTLGTTPFVYRVFQYTLLWKHMVCGYGYFCFLNLIPHRCNSENLKAPLLFVTAKSFPLSVLVPLFHQQNLCLNSCNLAFLQFAWMQHCSSIVFAMYGCCM